MTSRGSAGSWNVFARGIDDGLGLFGYVYSVSSDGALVPESFTSAGCTPGMLDVLPFAATRHRPEFIRQGYLGADAPVASLIPGWKESGAAAYGRAHAILESWGIIGRNLQGRGCAILISRRREEVPSPAQRAEFIRIALHLGAAQRLRDRLRVANALERAEAVLAPDGSVAHATGKAKSAESLDELRGSARAVERARGKLRRNEPGRALGMWKGLAAARWTLISHFESDGRRYILAQENEIAHAAPGPLSVRERQVLANAALGRSNKEIAYALGLAHSTVRVLLTRAAKKLGVRTRSELVERFETMNRTALSASSSTRDRD